MTSNNNRAVNGARNGSVAIQKLTIVAREERNNNGSGRENGSLSSGHRHGQRHGTVLNRRQMERKTILRAIGNQDRPRFNDCLLKYKRRLSRNRTNNSNASSLDSRVRSTVRSFHLKGRRKNCNSNQVRLTAKRTKRSNNSYNVYRTNDRHRRRSVSTVRNQAPYKRNMGNGTRRRTTNRFNTRTRNRQLLLNFFRSYSFLFVY